MADPDQDPRATLRDRYRKARSGLSQSARQNKQTHLAAHLAGCQRITSANCVAAYCALAEEADPLAGLNAFTGQIALPRVGRSGSMTFHHWIPGAPLTPGPLGIREPAGTGTPVEPANIQVMLLPLVAYDDHGTRLGMGGGYYDRFLGQAGTRPWLLGVAFACQHHKGTLPRAEWDQPLDAVVTENGVLEFA